MTKAKIVVLFSLLLSTCLAAGQANYSVSLISPALLEKASAVKRNEQFKVEIVSGSKIKWKRKYAITILNESGDRHAEFYEYYDNLRDVRSIEGRLFDANGNKIKTLKRSDIRDNSAVSDINLFDDNRIKLHNFYYRNYPYTVEYEVEVDLEATYFLPRYMPQPFSGISVEESYCQLICPKDFSFQFKAFNYTGPPTFEEKDGKKIYTWGVKNLTPWQEEYASPAKEMLTTSVFFSPNHFEFAGYEGSMSSWKELGLFQHRLNLGRDQLPESVRKRVRELMAQTDDPRQQVTLLYEYLQKNTRYVSIQLGIGGWQPFHAAFVAEKAYGDCKALSNYMCAILKEAGIKSFYSLIKAGQGEYFFMPDFPSDQFNHIIVCVPLENDTMWLECTDQFIGAGYMGDFTDNRYALLVDETGGKLVRTPRYSKLENLQIRKTIAALRENATLEVKVNSQYGAMQQDNIMRMINSLSRNKVREYLDKQLDFATYNVNDFNYREKKGRLPVIDEELHLTINNYATITNKRLFIAPNMMTRSYAIAAPDDARKYDIEMKTEYREVDTVEIQLPVGYELEVFPKDVIISSPFGTYSSSVKLEDNKLYYYRVREQFAGQFPTSRYTDLVEFYDTIYKADRNRVVLIKKGL
jgi:hypothetical protein